MDKDKDDILKHLQRTNRLLARTVSPTYQFYISVIQGIGTAIGVTLIGGIVIGILNSFVHSVYDIPILGKIVGELQYLFATQ